MRRDRQRAVLPTLPPFRGEESDRDTFLLYPERSRTADERTAPKVKSQEAVHIACYADPGALPDFAGFLITASE